MTPECPGIEDFSPLPKLPERGFAEYGPGPCIGERDTNDERFR